MGRDIIKRQRENKGKISKLAKDRKAPESSGGEAQRETPAGRRLAALKKRKAQE